MNLSNADVFGILEATLHALEAAMGCRGRFKLRLTSTTQTTPDELPQDYVDELRRKYGFSDKEWRTWPNQPTDYTPYSPIPVTSGAGVYP